MLMVLTGYKPQSRVDPESHSDISGQLWEAERKSYFGIVSAPPQASGIQEKNFSWKYYEEYDKL